MCIRDSYDYCLFILNYPEHVGYYLNWVTGLPTDYMGYVNYVPSNGGGYFTYYIINVNTNRSYNVYRRGEFNSYTAILMPSLRTHITCTPFRYTGLSVLLNTLRQGTIPIYFKASKLNKTIASLTESINIGHNSATWIVGVDNPYLFCTAAKTIPGAVYPVGFKVSSNGGFWALVNGLNGINTALSPIFMASGSVCYPIRVNASGIYRYYVVYFNSTIYFILQYNPFNNYTLIKGPQIAISEPQIMHYLTSTCPRLIKPTA